MLIFNIHKGHHLLRGIKFIYFTDLGKMFFLKMLFFQGLFFLFLSGSSPSFWACRCCTQASHVTANAYKQHLDLLEPCSAFNRLVHEMTLVLNWKNDKKAWLSHVDVKQWGIYTVKVDDRTQMWDRVDETDKQKDSLEFTSDMTDVYVNIGHVRTSLNVECTEQDNVGQTDRIWFEVSLSYLCLRHLWH